MNSFPLGQLCLLRASFSCPFFTTKNVKIRGEGVSGSVMRRKCTCSLPDRYLDEVQYKFPDLKMKVRKLFVAIFFAFGIFFGFFPVQITL